MIAKETLPIQHTKLKEIGLDSYTKYLDPAYV